MLISGGRGDVRMTQDLLDQSNVPCLLIKSGRLGVAQCVDTKVWVRDVEPLAEEPQGCLEIGLGEVETLGQSHGFSSGEYFKACLTERHNAVLAVFREGEPDCLLREVDVVPVENLKLARTAPCIKKHPEEVHGVALGLPRLPWWGLAVGFQCLKQSRFKCVGQDKGPLASSGQSLDEALQGDRPVYLPVVITKVNDCL